MYKKHHFEHYSPGNIISLQRIFNCEKKTVPFNDYNEINIKGPKSADSPNIKKKFFKTQISRLNSKSYGILAYV